MSSEFKVTLFTQSSLLHNLPSGKIFFFLLNNAENTATWLTQPAYFATSTLK